MARIVMKFGGTSVGDIERIQHVARTVKAQADAGHEIAVVVSAMAGTTNQLVGWTRNIAQVHDTREYDTVVATGEQITVGLLAMALNDLGVPARSWLGWQLPIRTTDMHGAARIQSIDVTGIEERFSQGVCAVVAGFQGISDAGRITTLGRGGSDTSAVALAAALRADRCDIYTDVDGVYTTDPRIVPQARKRPMIAFEEMLEMASLGAKVLQTRSVEMAYVHQVRLCVRSSFAPETPGTIVCPEEEIMEQEVVTGVAYSRNEAQVTLRGVKDRPGVAAQIFGPLADAGLNVDMIIQNISSDGEQADITFTVLDDQVAKAREVLDELQDMMQAEEVIFKPGVSKISIIGIGMRSHAGVAAKMFACLAERSINILAITTSEIKISVLIDEAYTELAVRSLHEAYGLAQAQQAQ